MIGTRIMVGTYLYYIAICMYVARWPEKRISKMWSCHIHIILLYIIMSIEQTCFAVDVYYYNARRRCFIILGLLSFYKYHIFIIYVEVSRGEIHHTN